jgi:signal transduction histidine kinase
MRGMPHPPEGWRDPGREGEARPGMPFMWGQRWGGLRGDPAQLFPSLPKQAKIRRFWEGSAFGVAVPAQSFAGVIAIHADAEYLVNFRREIGLQRLIEDLGRQAGVAGVTLLDRELTVLASSDGAAVGRQEADPFLREAARTGTTQGRRQMSGTGREIYEMVKPFTLEGQRVGLIRLALSNEGLSNVTRQAQQSIFWYSLGLVIVGILGSIGIFWIQARHLRERRALEGAIVHEQRLSAMGNLAAGVAHEVRNPLNAISIGLQRLRREFPPVAPVPCEEYGHLTRIIEAEVTRLNTILERFLTLARPLKLSLTVEPLEPVLAEVLSLLGPQAEAQRVRIDQEVRLAGSRIAMDRSQLLHAFLNVVLNAIQAMPRGGTIHVRATTADGDAPGPGARIVIADTGPGIPADHLDRIFEPYFTTKDGGTGLGLALAHKIVQEHGGTIRAWNQPEGGASFEILLPLAPESA